MWNNEENYRYLIERLRRPNFCQEQRSKAAEAIETLLTERNILHAHVVTDWLGDCHCSNCKGNIDYTSSYCNWCGAKLDEPEERE